MRKSSRRRLNRPFLEPLEPRVLLSGLTIITHGAEFLSTDRPSWLDSMAAAIRNRVGSDVAIYTLRMEPVNGQIVATNFTRLSGPAPTSSSNDETILLLDWAAASGVNLLGLSADYSTTTVAAAVMPYLTTAYPAIGLNAPLVEGSIQLIGHSRGASLNSELARDLGQEGIWVDQLTSLDSAPVPPDPSVVIHSNVIFADNYWQDSGDGLLVPNGVAIAGAYNVGPLALGGAYGVLDGQTHGDVHLFYFGTIDTASGASDGTANVVDSWYASNNLVRAQTGFYYSRLGGGSAARPLSGISTAFGGTASRTGLTHVGDQWANLATIALPSTVLGAGASFDPTFRYGSYNTSATITWFLDPDTNPYNNNSIALTAGSTVAATGDNVVKTTASLLASASIGTYYLEGRITNTTGTRYAYSSAFALINPNPFGAINIAGPAQLTGWAADPNTLDQAVAITLKVDGATFYTGNASVSRSDLIPTLGSANHGFVIDLSALSPGIHRIDLYADDTTTGDPTLIATRTISTNSPPEGAIDSLARTQLTGWAFDPNSGAASIQIAYQIDGNPPVLATANVNRPDLQARLGSALHGFSIALPQLEAGTHHVSVWAVDPVSKALTLLGKQAIYEASPMGDALPFGGITILSAAALVGWAFDPSTPRNAITVRVDVDGTAGTPMTVDGRFSQALALAPGEHRIDLYVLDSTSHTPVLIASRLVTQASGAGLTAPTGALEAVSAATISGWAWASALADAPALIRIDIDGKAGTAGGTNLLRTDINAQYAITGDHGFSLAAPSLAPGTHEVALVYLDPLTLTPTVLATQTLITT